MLPDAVPKFLRQRPVAFALQKKVAEEIDQLVQKRIWEPVADSKWAAPIVPVLNRNGTVRLCADYRATVNPAVASDVFPLLTFDEALATLAGGKCFTKLDLKDAYAQVPVDEAASEVLTVNTQRGLFQVKRFPFGLKAAPGIFHRSMISLMKGLDGLRYRPGKLMGGADDLSRLPMPYKGTEIEPQPPEVFLLEVEPEGPCTAVEIARATSNDRTSRVGLKTAYQTS
ncbi:hypothetical protein TTRE_0000768301 [Trichuris trichiura]|uniref:Reverse transcriptase domain-containing protein n=1 Tax=Trichuris trichiura TaxID=36087 RepID=A0A077ZG76_TRITR|nr:hypothetical protein TTRE_0000768301 [Trichuris trichiura]